VELNSDFISKNQAVKGESIKTFILFNWDKLPREGGYMPECIKLSKGEILKLIESVDFEKLGSDPVPEDIAEEVEVYVEGSE